MLRRNHHVSLEYAYPQQTLFLPSVDRLSAEFGFLGRISNFFSYNIRAGYANKGYAPLDGALQVSDGVYRPCIGFSSYQKWYATLDWDLNLQAVRFDGQVVYERNWDIALAALFSSPAVSADVELMYNWRKRLSVGADCLFASARSNAAGQQVPWYADLGISAEYLLNRKLSFWIRGGNLLNMEIQRNLFFAEKGLNFTAGICLIF